MRFYDFFISYKLGLKELNHEKTIWDRMVDLRHFWVRIKCKIQEKTIWGIIREAPQPFKESIQRAFKRTKGENARILCNKIIDWIHNVFFCVLIVLFAVMMWADYNAQSLLCCGLLAALFVVTLIYLHACSSKRIMENRLDKRCKPYSNKRMDMVVDLLDKYNIDITDEKSIDLLIEEAKQEQINNDIFSFNRGYIKVFITAIVSGIIFLLKKIIDAIDFSKLLDELKKIDLGKLIDKLIEIITTSQWIEILVLFVALIVMIISILYLGDVFMAFIRALFCTDYDKYNELISDLKQIKIFYKKPITKMANTAADGTTSDDTEGAPVASGSRHTCMR